MCCLRPLGLWSLVGYSSNRNWIWWQPHGLLGSLAAFLTSSLLPLSPCVHGLTRNSPLSLSDFSLFRGLPLLDALWLPSLSCCPHLNPEPSASQPHSQGVGGQDGARLAQVRGQGALREKEGGAGSGPTLRGEQREDLIIWEGP